MRHLVCHVDYSDPTLVVTKCGLVLHVNEVDHLIEDGHPNNCGECESSLIPAGYTEEDLDSCNPFLPIFDHYDDHGE